MKEGTEKAVQATCEDVAAALLPLVQEYFEGTCRREQDRLVYTDCDGTQFVIAVSKA